MDFSIAGSVGQLDQSEGPLLDNLSNLETEQLHNSNYAQKEKEHDDDSLDDSKDDMEYSYTNTNNIKVGNRRKNMKSFNGKTIKLLSNKSRSIKTQQNNEKTQPQLQFRTEQEDSEQDDSVNNNNNRNNINKTNCMKEYKSGKSREYFNAASRKTRRKRKLEREGLMVRNSELETEQQRFRSMIANLQNEIQNLKNNQCIFGKIDLETENLLLRAEVKRHKMFIQQVTRLACSTVPKYQFSPQERIKLANNGIESAIGQLLGMCYTSIVDRNWTQPFRFDPKIEKLAGVTIICRYQLLPLGSTPKTAARINIRQDVHNMPLESMGLLKAVALGKDLKKEREIGELYEDVKDPDANTLVELRELDFDFDGLSIQKNYIPAETENVKVEEDQETLIGPLKVFCSTRRKTDAHNKEHRTIECITLRAEAEKSVNAFGFPTLDESLHLIESNKNKAHDDNGETVSRNDETIELRRKAKATLVVRTRAPKLAPQENAEKIERFKDPLLEGFIIRQQDNGRGLTITTCSSEPVYESNSKKIPPLNDLGEISEDELPSVVRVELAMSRFKLEKLLQWQPDTN